MCLASFSQSRDVQAFRLGTTILSHICYCTALQGSCVETILSATGCANSSKREQSHQHEARRMKETQNKTSKIQGSIAVEIQVKKQGNFQFFMQKNLVIYLIDITDCWTSLRNSVKYMLKMEILVNSGQSLSPVLYFILFLYLWTFQKENLEICLFHLAIILFFWILMNKCLLRKSC